MDATEEFFDQLGRRGHEPRLEIFSGVIRFEIEQDGRIDQWFVKSNRGDVEVSRESDHAEAAVHVERALFNSVVRGQAHIILRALAGDVLLTGSAVGTAVLQRLFERANPPRRPVATNPRERVATAQNLVTILDGNAFIASDVAGDIDASAANPVGFFFHDTRLVSEWILTINGQRLTQLSVDNVHYYEVHFFLVPGPGSAFAAASALSVVRERTLCDGLCETLTILNYSETPVDLSVRVDTDADFASFYDVGGPIAKKGDYYREVGDEHLLLGYQREHFYRETTIAATEPARFDEHGLTITVHIEPQHSWSTQLTAIPRRGVVPREVGRSIMERRGPADMERDLTDWLGRAPRLQSDWAPLSDIYQRSLVDLFSLRFRTLAEPDPDYLFVAAGLPWFMATFGRDSIIASLQALPFAPQLARSTLFTLAIWQGSQRDDFRDESPGRIPDEIRRGESVVFDELPHFPSYASADATPLFLVLLDEYERWTGDADLVRRLEHEARTALTWIDGGANLVGNGYISYGSRDAGTGQGNQCWKNTPEAICYHDGRLPGFPRATAELQGYAYDAKLRAARLARQVWNDPTFGDKLEHQADDLKQRFNHDFWLEDRQYFAVALDADGGRVDALTSNIGHLLWSGIVDDDKARPLVDHLLGPRLFSGWGVRTLADGEARYNPIGYHTGTVWPFDNSLIAWGLRRYGYDEEAARLAAGILDAAVTFDGRLPETFGGYPRALTRYPVTYPEACNPHATSAGTPLLLLRTILGLEPRDGKLGTRPALPVNLGHLRLLDIPGRWGRSDAYARGLIETDWTPGLRPQLGLPSAQTTTHMRR